MQNDTVRKSHEASSDIARESNLSREDFARKYLGPLKPVILTDAARDWAATRLWTREYLKERCGGHRVTVDGKEYTLAEILDSAWESTPDRPSPYLRSRSIPRLFPELVPDLQPHLVYTQPNRLCSSLLSDRVSEKLPDCRLAVPELLIGGPGSGFPVLHYDAMHVNAFVTQVCGDKEFIVFSPDQTPFLYPKPDGPNLSSIADVDNPDLTRFPLFARAKVMRSVVRQGETIFVPSGWWHVTRVLSPSVAVSFNSVNSANWSLFARDTTMAASPLKRILMGPYLTAMGWGMTWTEQRNDPDAPIRWSP